MHIPQLVLVLSWPPAEQNNSFFVEHSVAAARNNKHLRNLKQNLEFPVPTHIDVKF